jgi:hypothetical protein
MNRRNAAQNTMLDWAKAIHEAIGIESPRLFIAVFALIGFLLFGLVGWIIDRGYRMKLREHHTDSPIVLAAKHDRDRLSGVPERAVPSESIMTLTPPPLSSVPSEATGRIFVPTNVDYKFLMGLYHQTTSVQADSLAAFYTGKWIRLSAPVADVFTQGDEIFVIAMLDPNVPVAVAILSFKAEQWTASVSMLTPGSTIKVAGEILVISARSIRLKCCELL